MNENESEKEKENKKKNQKTMSAHICFESVSIRQWLS